MSDSSFANIEKASVDEKALDARFSDSSFEVSVFDAQQLELHGINASESVWMEMSMNSKLYKLTIGYVSTNHKGSLASFTPLIKPKGMSLADKILGDGAEQNDVSMQFGVGLAEFEHTFENTTYTLHAVHQRRGPVVGTDCEPQIMQNLVVFCHGKDNKHVLVDFCKKLLDADDHAGVNEFQIFRWKIQHGYWARSGTKSARSLDSVVLPAASKEKIVNDLDDFLTRETYFWYTEHGIPYKRSFLFYGVPGAGKTSLIQSLAGKYKRNLCILQPTDPNFTDDKLADAIKAAPSRSIIVLEDVDALFGKDRSVGNSKIQITFSGLLNALDGISNPDGQIFILTTNFREHLDSALIRNGRVDLHVEFTHAQPEQMEHLFQQFYPQAEATQAQAFRANLVQLLGARPVNMAALQHYFIGKRKASPAEAAEGVQQILDDLNEKAEGKAEGEAEAAKKEAAAKAESKSKDGKKKQGKRKSKGRGAQAVHVHIHTAAGSGGSDSEEDEAEVKKEKPEEEE